MRVRLVFGGRGNLRSLDRLGTVSPPRRIELQGVGLDHSNSEIATLRSR